MTRSKDLFRELDCRALSHLSLVVLPHAELSKSQVGNPGGDVLANFRRGREVKVGFFPKFPNGAGLISAPQHLRRRSSRRLRASPYLRKVSWSASAANEARK